MNDRFTLQVYNPGSDRDVWVILRSPYPFTIAAGDLLNPGVWEGSQSPMKILRVVNLEHWFGGNDATGTMQTTMVYTEEVDSDSEPNPRLTRR